MSNIGNWVEKKLILNFTLFGDPNDDRIHNVTKVHVEKIAEDPIFEIRRGLLRDVALSKLNYLVSKRYILNLCDFFLAYIDNIIVKYPKNKHKMLSYVILNQLKENLLENIEVFEKRDSEAVTVEIKWGDFYRFIATGKYD